jgi:hypothetical protein
MDQEKHMDEKHQENMDEKHQENMDDQPVADKPLSEAEESFQNQIDFINCRMEEFNLDVQSYTKDIQDAAKNVAETPFENFERAKDIAQDAIATLSVVTCLVSTAAAMRSKLRTLVKRAPQIDNAGLNSFITYSETHLEDLENCIKHSANRARFYTSLAAALVNIEFDDNMTIIPYWCMSGFIVDQTDCSRATVYCVYMNIGDKLYSGKFRSLDFGPFGSGLVYKLSKLYVVEAKKQKKPEIRFDNVPYASFDDTDTHDPHDSRNITMCNITMRVKFVKFGDDGKITFICVIRDADTKEVLVYTYIALHELNQMKIENATEFPSLVESFKIKPEDLKFTDEDTIDCGEEMAYLKEGFGQCY